MTAKELAQKLNGREIGGEITNEEAKAAKESGLVVVFGYSDDNMEFDGAVQDEVGCFEGATIYLTKTGVLQELDCSQEDCPYYIVAKNTARAVKAVWHDNGNPCWTYETEIPHETFKIMENGEVFCVGIVFDIKDVDAGPAQAGMGNKKPMNRMTTDNPQGNLETALNLFYAKDGWTWVRGYGLDEKNADISLNDLVRLIAKQHDLEMAKSDDDEEIVAEMAEMLIEGTEIGEGVVALLYCAGWVCAELRARLMAYEDTGMTPEEIAERTSSDPLTLEELLEMEGKPVWNDTTKRYVLVDTHNRRTINVCGQWRTLSDRYYRSKPEEKV